MQLPDAVLRAVSVGVTTHPDNPADATTLALQTIQALENYTSLIGSLVQQCIQDAVYDERHRRNKIIRREAGLYGAQQQVRRGPSQGAAVGKVYETVYNYYIAGKTIGLVLGCELATIARSEKGVAEGHMFNVRLCEALQATGIQPGQTVRQAVSERQLNLIFSQVREQVRAEAS